MKRFRNGSDSVMLCLKKSTIHFIHEYHLPFSGNLSDSYIVDVTYRPNMREEDLNEESWFVKVKTL